MAMMEHYFKVNFAESVLGSAETDVGDLVFLPDSKVVEGWKEFKLKLVEGDWTDYLLSEQTLRICLEKMRDILDRGALPGDRLQWLPVWGVARGGKSKPYYVLHLPAPPDILDREHSTIINDMIVKPVFRADALSEHGVFSHLGGSETALFVAASVKEKLEEAECTGLEFSPAQIFPPTPSDEKPAKGKSAPAKGADKSKSGSAKAPTAKKTAGFKEVGSGAGKTPTLAQMAEDVLEIGNLANDPASGYRKLLDYLAKCSTKAVIRSLEGAAIDKDTASIRAQLLKLREKVPPPRGVKAVYFGLFDTMDDRGQESIGFYVTGHDEYDNHDPDSLGEPSWEPEGRYLRSQVLQQVKTAELAVGARGDAKVKALLGYAGQLGVAILLAKFASAGLFRKGTRYVVGFDSGDVVEVS
jgi:hypothetical protein